jgi:hypothetical protein
MSHFLFEMWLNIDTRKQQQTEGNEMTTNYLSKIQVKNLIIKGFGKREVSQTLKGRICYHSTTGYTFDTMADGFVEVGYTFSATGSFDALAERRAAALEKADAYLIGLGFEKTEEQEFTGWNEDYTVRNFRTVVGYRKTK